MERPKSLRMNTQTIFLGRLIGLYCITVSIAVGVNRDATIQVVTATAQNGPVLFVFGAILVAAGLAMILSHNIWSGGALPVVVTIVAWLTLIKGLFCLIFPPPAAVGVILSGLASEPFFYLDLALVFVLGAYLTYASFSGAASAARR